MENQYVISGTVSREEESHGLLFQQGNALFEIENITGDAAQWNTLIKACDGKAALSEILSRTPSLDKEAALAFLDALVDNNLGYINNSGQAYLSGDEAILILEDLQAKLLYSTLYKNKFWQAMQTPGDVPEKVYYGMAIENYHFLFRESWFDSPVLSFQMSTKARLIMNEFYGEEYGHDELILKALNHIDIQRADISETLPLPETLALCNALAYWSANDPLFFFSTMGILEGKDIKVDSYILAMEQSGKVSESFIKPIKEHANINIDAEHGILTRELFHEIPVVRLDQMKSMIANTYLFVELYDNFHSAVWNHYADDKKPLLRRLSNI
ncbi:hypothetical protein P0E69_06610 [Chimaeribacter arupi]|uniref:Iron-containing redox enzyme family protein n=2 Tax=Yersiniaceae TaxID=1903411 RepID=A0A2N5EJJ2_9GAMM|nr:MULTISPECIES: iron-containing redox enzyme family protein [Yersiniaceae]MBS0967758.1 hypothetical protein [Nissabacter archeti]MDV5140801.1 hypothetical protein [Chimaeribacter arupi]PLR45689.1 hypothetical protein CYR34_17305 [Chimaeribacter arupi]WKZ93559.1 hypothetical protein P0E69_06610 [Chimaeribacter arupi]